MLAGFSKTAVGGIAALSVALLAAVLPAKESTAVMLLLFIIGDLVAVRAYHAHVEWRVLVRLSPYVVVGIVGGVLFMAQVGDSTMRRTIGVLLLALLAVHVWERRRGGRPVDIDAGGPAEGAAVRWFFGVAAGFTSMVANAGGAVMTVYLLSAGVGMWGFLGTTAWFFFAVNVFKTPFTAGLGLFTADGLLLVAALAPAVLAGAVLGRTVVRRLDQRVFEVLVVGATVAGALYLIV